MAGALVHKVTLITGAGRGIGAAAARLLAREGASVVLASRNQAELSRVAAEIKAAGGQALAVRADISLEEDVLRLFEQAHASFGPVNILVNNAAIIEKAEIADMDLDIWEQVIRVNVRGPFLCSREALRQMIKAGKGGTIINMTSLSGVRGPEKFSGMGAYVVSKYAILGLSEILAVEGRPHGIRVNSIAPGAVQTAMLKKAAPFLKTRTTPEDIARTILYLADDQQSGHITGANIEIFSNE